MVVKYLVDYGQVTFLIVALPDELIGRPQYRNRTDYLQ
jgi:hypothetical protein